jgi:hypothetical protein
MMWSISDVCSDRRSLSAFFNLFFFNPLLFQPLFLQAETLKHSSVDTRRLIRSARLVQRMRNAALEGSWVELDILLQSEDVAAIVGGINVSTNGEEEGEEGEEEGEEDGEEEGEEDGEEEGEEEGEEGGMGEKPATNSYPARRQQHARSDSSVVLTNHRVVFVLSELQSEWNVVARHSK